MRPHSGLSGLDREQDLFLGDEFPLRPHILKGIIGQGKVQVAPHELLPDVLRRHDAVPDLGVRVIHMEFVPDQQKNSVRGRGHADLVGLLPGQGVELLQPQVKRCKHLIQGAGKDLSAVVELDLSFDPVEQRGPRIVLHPSDDLTQGRLRDVQPLGSIADVLHFRHHAKAFQLI